MDTRNRFLLLVSLKTIANFFILSGVLYLLWAFLPIIKIEFSFWWKQTFAQTIEEHTELIPETDSSFGEILKIPPPLKEQPVDPNGSIIIEKIEVNSPIVYDVSVTDKNAYFTALEKGVAHAQGTQKPSESPGNTYLFAHSTPNPFEIKRYGAVFTLLDKLEENDRITIYHNGTRFDYTVQKVSIVKAFDLSPLTEESFVPTLTLQTCSPPGIPINRLIVKAVLDNVYVS